MFRKPSQLPPTRPTGPAISRLLFRQAASGFSPATKIIIITLSIVGFGASNALGATILATGFRIESADSWNLSGNSIPIPSLSAGSHPSSPTILADYWGITGGQILLNVDPGELITSARIEWGSGGIWYFTMPLAFGAGFPTLGAQAGDQVWYSPNRNAQIYDDIYRTEIYHVRFVLDSNLGTFVDDNQGENYLVIGTVPELRTSALFLIGIVCLIGKRYRFSR